VGQSTGAIGSQRRRFALAGKWKPWPFVVVDSDSRNSLLNQVNDSRYRLCRGAVLPTSAWECIRDSHIELL